MNNYYQSKCSSRLYNKLIEVKKLIVLCMVFFFLLPQVSNSQTLLRGPQKIVKDQKRNRLLVSNYNTGDIVQIDSTGKQSYFVKAADFIDGIEIFGDIIYGTGSNRKLRGYDLETKQLVMNITISGGAFGKYLSSVTADSLGHLYISCPDLNTIYKLRISDQKYWVFAKNNGLNRPNGILVEKNKNRLVIIDDSDIPSLIHAISLSDSTVSTLFKTNFYYPDGIVRDKYGSYFVGGYYLDGIYKFDSEFSQPPVLIHPGLTFVYPTYNPMDNTLLIASYNNNTWEKLSLITGVEETNGIPKNFVVYQNFPNPFNPVTNIKYELATMEHVNLTIYDSLGQEIIVLVNEQQSPGFHAVSFDGSSFSSGVYYYKIAVGNYSESSKMILLK